jgi:hypothetical protein
MGMLDGYSRKEEKKLLGLLRKQKNRGNLRTLVRTESKKLPYTKKTLVKVRA